MVKRGVTLIELIIVLSISGIVILAVTAQFVTALSFQSMIGDQATATTEAEMAMHSMTRVLRYAKYSQPVTTPDDTSGTSVKATISGNGYLDEIPLNVDTPVTFTRIKTGDDANKFTYKIGSSGTANTIATGITFFSAKYPADASDPTNHNLVLNITATKNTRSSSLESQVHLLGG